MVWSRVMLTENIWISWGLVNGALGTVRDIVWRSGDDPQSSPPLAVLIKFDRYTGPACFPDRPELDGVVPIFRSRREFLRGSVNCSCTQFPLTIAYAITVHKSQGATLERAVVDISGKDFAAGLTYVAVSRVETIEGLMFDAPFDLDDLRMSRTNNHIHREIDVAERAGQRVTEEMVPAILEEVDLYNAI